MSRIRAKNGLPVVGNGANVDVQSGALRVRDTDL